MGLTYDPAVFAVRDIEEAKRIILTPEDSTTEARWARETGYLADLIERELEVSPATVLLDYGCGIGRIAKALLERQDCTVVGVDISPQMRMLALAYVQSSRFTTCAPEMLDTLLACGLRFDAAVSVWVLQHCHQPEQDIALIRAALEPGAKLLVVNNERRAVPTREEGWVDDGVDVRALLAAAGFEVRKEGRLERAMTTPLISEHAFWACFGV